MIAKNGGTEADDNGSESMILQESDMLINESALFPGDVLIYRPHTIGKVGGKISKVTDSPYTHAAIYLGDGLVAESNVPNGVEKNSVMDSIKDCRCIAVLRSQLGFTGDRPEKLSEFVESVLACNNSYDFFNVLRFEKQSNEYFDNRLAFIKTNYGKITSPDQLAKQRFFCSAFVVACYVVVGIIGETAQVAYQPNHFSPGQLYKDATFGWSLGFLVPKGGGVPEDDPILTQATFWRDLPNDRWWLSNGSRG